MKNITYGEINHNRTPSSVFIHTKTRSVIVEGNITVMRYRNDDIRSIYFLHICAHLDMMMLARDYASCHAATRTLVMIVANNVQQLVDCKKYGFKSYRPLVGPNETQATCIAATTKSRGAHTCYLSNMCGHSTTYSHRYILSRSTRYPGVDSTPGGCAKY